jgi:site-specific DNA-adenine methylase
MLNIPKNNIFKWIGGKKWLEKNIKLQLDKIEDTEQIKVYIEPFAGGLGSFKSILPFLISKNIEKIILNDINTITITTFKHIQDNIEELIKEYSEIHNKFQKSFPSKKIKCMAHTKVNGKLVLTEGEYYYYELQKTKDKEALKELFLVSPRDYFNSVKKDFNKDKLAKNLSVKNSARFLFLMQYCFNGVYRENLKGEFNVPFNWGNTVINLDLKIKDFKDYNILFNSVDITFENRDVFELLREYYSVDNCFIYLDPPYYNEEGQENKYNKDHFGLAEQNKLLEATNYFDIVLYSNHSSFFIETFFNENGQKVDIQKVYRKNIMSSKNSSRNEDKEEVLILSH